MATAQLDVAHTENWTVKEGTETKQITLRIDEDVLDWFKRQGAGYQTHINTLLREYVKAQRAID